MMRVFNTLAALLLLVFTSANSFADAMNTVGIQAPTKTPPTVPANQPPAEDPDGNPGNIGCEDIKYEEQLGENARVRGESNAIHDNNSRCWINQNDAFVKARQQANYIAIYTATSKFDTAKDKETLEKCITDPNSCTQEDRDNVLKVVLARNFLVDTRTKIAQLNTAKESMRSLNDPKKPIDIKKMNQLSDIYYRPGTSSDMRSSFVLDRNKAKEILEREIMGQDFVSQYRAFVDKYARTKGENPDDPNQDWYKAIREQSTDGTYSIMVIDKNKENPDGYLDEAGKKQKQRDAEILNSAVVKQEVDNLEKDLNKEWNSMSDSEHKKLIKKMADVGMFIAQKEKEKRIEEVTKAVDQINEVMNKGDKPESADVNRDSSFSKDAFAKFLDKIWPSSAADQKPDAITKRSTASEEAPGSEKSEMDYSKSENANVTSAVKNTPKAKAYNRPGISGEKRE